MHFRPSVCSVALGLCLLCTRLSKHFSVVHSAVTFCAGDTRLLFKRPLKFRNVLKYTESRTSVACSQIIKESPQRWRFSVALKQNETNLNQTKKTDPPRRQPRNARVISAEELAAIMMSKSNLMTDYYRAFSTSTSNFSRQDTVNYY